LKKPGSYDGDKWRHLLPPPPVRTLSLASPAALVDSALAVVLSHNARPSPMDDWERGELPVSNQGRRWKFSVESDAALK
jgi:hypothetical protein